jgi:hypothetical protein
VSDTIDTLPNVIELGSSTYKSIAHHENRFYVVTENKVVKLDQIGTVVSVTEMGFGSFNGFQSYLNVIVGD